jgi:hypothetical protein
MKEHKLLLAFKIRVRRDITTMGLPYKKDTMRTLIRALELKFKGQTYGLYRTKHGSDRY